MGYIIGYILIGILVSTLFWIWHTISVKYKNGSPMLVFLPIGVMLWPVLVYAILSKI